MERIEAATAEAQRLSRRLGRVAGPIRGLLVGKRSLADEIAGFLRGQPAVEEAVDRLARMVTVERPVEETAGPRVLREWRSERARLADRAAKACRALAAGPAGTSLVEDLARVEDRLRGPRQAQVPEVAIGPGAGMTGTVPAGRFGAQWEQYRSQQGWGALVNAIGPMAIAAMALEGSGAGTIGLFFLWGWANLRWLRRMARWPCPSCGKPFAQWRVLFAPYCEHCGLKKFDGARPEQLGPGGPAGPAGQGPTTR